MIKFIIYSLFLIAYFIFILFYCSLFYTGYWLIFDTVFQWKTPVGFALIITAIVLFIQFGEISYKIDELSNKMNEKLKIKK